MKLKHKQLGIELPIASDFVRIPGRAGAYYHTTGDSFIAHNDTAWEVVKEEVWEDVTSEYMTNGLVIGLTSSPAEWSMAPTDRFRKVNARCVNGEAFIVERKK